jgi:hypothetical protein
MGTSHAIKITAGLWDSYKHFRKKYRLVHPDVDRKEYVNICHAINKGLANKIIKESFEFRIPYGLGVLSIKKNKIKIKIKDGKLEKNKMIIDWDKTWKYWQSEYPGMNRKEIKQIPNKTVIYNMNDHSDGYIMGWNWDKTTCRTVNQTVYNFKPTKGNRLALAAWIKSDERCNDYYLRNKYNGKGIKSYTSQLRKEKEGVSNVVEESI